MTPRLQKTMEEMAEKFVHAKICFGGLEYSLSGNTAKECRLAYLEGATKAVTERDKELLEGVGEFQFPIPNYKIDSWGMDTATAPVWPDKITGCDEFNKAIHDPLCDILEAKGYSENDVCTASVGMWGAINVTRDYFEKQFDQLKLKLAALVVDRNDQLRSVRDVFRTLRETEKELASLREENERLKAGVDNGFKCAQIVREQDALLRECLELVKHLDSTSILSADILQLKQKLTAHLKG